MGDRIPGKLKLSKAKKGNIVANIHFKKEDGKPGEMTLPKAYTEKMKDISLDGKDVEFEREGGQITAVYMGGQELPKAEAPAPQAQQNRPNQQATRNQTGQNHSHSTGGTGGGKGGSGGSSPQSSGGSADVQEQQMNLSDTLMPKDTRELQIKQIDNYYLRIQKSGIYEVPPSGNQNQKNKKFNIYKYKDFNFRSVPFTDIAQRYASSTQACFPLNHVFTAENDWRMVVGLGHETVYEVSMTLHPVHGFPYIPSSSIKGITRSWVITNLFNGSEADALQDEGFSLIFGSPGTIKDDNKKEVKTAKGELKGGVVFLDAYPVRKPTISVDIMNPHYGEYYQSEGAKPPADVYEPVPVQFLVCEDGVFQFGLGAYTEIPIEKGVFQGRTAFDVAKEWLEKALTERGVGAKTSLGYGFFAINR